MKVSIIIPVYNVEQCLNRCLSSVASQTYKDFEAIIVNDGSTDNSLDIIEKYVGENDNFKLFTIENRGLGGARNFGIEQSAGEYFIFLDSDDYIAENCIEKFMEAAERDGSDIVACNSCDVTEAGEPLSYSKNSYLKSPTDIYSEPQILFNRFSAWGKMYKKELFENRAFVSREWYEDLRMVPKLYLDCKKISYIEDVLFFYVQRAGSIMNNPNVKRNIEIVTAFEDVIDYYKSRGVYDKFEDEIEFMIIDHIVLAAITRVVSSDSADGNNVLADIQKYIEKFPNLSKNKYVKTLSKVRQLIFMFNKNKLYFLTKLCFKLKNRG